MALGAQRGLVLRLIVREGMIVAAIGIGVGLAGALSLSWVLASLVFDVQVRDPLTFVAVAVSLAAVALFACAIPAARPRASIRWWRCAASSAGLLLSRIERVAQFVGERSNVVGRRGVRPLGVSATSSASRSF